MTDKQKLRIEIIDWGYVGYPPDEIVLEITIGERTYRGCLTEIDYEEEK